ncbi:MAG: hypothetical protein DSZ15_04005, partial [Candidatus Thioglobus sp.]
WDHGFLLNDRDQELLTALKSLTRSKIFLFSDENPTAEVMAKRLFGVIIIVGDLQVEQSKN